MGNGTFYVYIIHVEARIVVMICVRKLIEHIHKNFLVYFNTFSTVKTLIIMLLNHDNGIYNGFVTGTIVFNYFIK